jgi:hypothetical protein
MRVQATGARPRRSARLAVIGCTTMTIFTSALVSACSTGTPKAGAHTSFSPGQSSSPTPDGTLTPSRSGTESPSPSPSLIPPASASPSPSPSASPSPVQTETAAASPSPSPFLTVAPATGGGGTAGFQDSLLAGLGALAVLAGAGSLAYRRRAVKSR